MPGREAEYGVLFAHWILLCLVLSGVFALFDRRPRRPPYWIARWGRQVAMVAVAVPVSAAIAYALMTIGLDPSWCKDPSRTHGYGFTAMATLVVAPWVAASVLLRPILGEAER
jgi:hypothetical protein